ncbi:MAG: ABC transporter permease [Mycobacterium sp.]
MPSATALVEEPITQKLKAPRLSPESSRYLLMAIDAVMPIATVALMVYFAIVRPVFLTTENLLVVAVQIAPTMVVAAGAALLLMAGFVDLSVGSVMAVAGVSAGLVFQSHGAIPGLLVGLGVGAVAGAFNGFLIGIFKLSPIVVTLGMLAAGRGLAQYLAPGSVFGFPESISHFGSGTLFGVSYLVVIAVVVVLVAMALLNWFPFGRHVIAVGVNQRAAFLLGISVGRLIFGLYLVVGVLAAVAGLLTVARLDSAPSGTLGSGFEVTVLTAVLLGAVPFTGGRGTIWRVVLGVWLIGILANGMTLTNVGPEVSGILTGAVLVLAATLEGIRYWVRKAL